MAEIKCFILLAISVHLAYCFIRSAVDKGTPVGDCNFNAPVYGSPVDNNTLGCYPKEKLVKLQFDFEKIKFLDLNIRTLIPITHITKAMFWNYDRWVRVSIKSFFISHHRFEYFPPQHGQLLYIQDKKYTHIFIRTFGFVATPTMIPPTSLTTKKPPTQLPTTQSSTQTFSTYSTVTRLSTIIKTTRLSSTHSKSTKSSIIHTIYT